MRIGRIESKALSFCLLVAITATYSMVALAGETRLAGEIVVSGTAVDGKAPVVQVNGEEVKSGRSIFTSSSITTDENSSATIKIGTVGTFRVAPGSSLTVSFDKDGIQSNLVNGSLSVLASENAVSVTMPDGTTSELSSGMTASTIPQDDDDDDDGGMAWWPWALVFGGAAAAIIIAATSDNNRVGVGGNTTIISPVR